MYGGIWIPPQSNKTCLICVVYVQQVFKHMGDIKTYGGVQTWGTSKHPGGIQIYGAYGHSLSVTKHAFFVLSMYGGIQTLSKDTGGASKHMGASKCMGHMDTPSV